MDEAYSGIAIQENVVRLEECTDRNVTKFSKGKHKVLHLEGGVMWQHSRPVPVCLGHDSAEKELDPVAQ